MPLGSDDIFNGDDILGGCCVYEDRGDTPPIPGTDWTRDFYCHRVTEDVCSLILGHWKGPDFLCGGYWVLGEWVVGNPCSWARKGTCCVNNCCIHRWSYSECFVFGGSYQGDVEPFMAWGDCEECESCLHRPSTPGVTPPYRTHTIEGNVITYVKDDVVKYKGKMYVATETIQGYNPEQSKLWKKLSDSLKYTSGTESHIDPQTGDVWFDTSSGISYTYFDDGNTVQWVELS